MPLNRNNRFAKLKSRWNEAIKQAKNADKLREDWADSTEEILCVAMLTACSYRKRKKEINLMSNKQWASENAEEMQKNKRDLANRIISKMSTKPHLVAIWDFPNTKWFGSQGYFDTEQDYIETFGNLFLFTWSIKK